MVVLRERLCMKRKDFGFTLVELMITLVVIGIAMSVAVPGFKGMVVRNRIISQTNEVILAVNLARSEASRTGGLVSIAAVSPTTTNEFGGGWCVVLGTPATCAGNVIRRFPALSGESTLNVLGENPNTDDVSVIQFNSLGGLVETGSQQINLDLCYPGYQGRRIQISIIGRVKSHVEALAGDPDPPLVQPNC